jgi:hypothetical protein
VRIPALGWTLSTPALAPRRIPPLALVRVRRQARLPALAQSPMYRREPARRAAATPARHTRRAAEKLE